MLSTIKQYWRILIIVLTPIVLLPLPILIPTIQSRCAYIVLLLTIYWVSEAISYAVASFLPIALFPMFGIVTGEKIAYSYFKDATTLFVGSMILAQAMEYVQLHRRLALFVLNYVGSSMKWSMAGLMSVTSLVSLWVNNSAATSIMLPAANAIIDEVENFEKKTFSSSSEKSTTPFENLQLTDELIQLNEPTNDSIDLKYDFHKLRIAFSISVAISAAVGGLVTLVGTPSNIFVKGFMEETYDNHEQFKFEISFGNFFLYGFPMGLVMLLFSWIWLQFLYNRNEFFSWRVDPAGEETGRRLHRVFQEQYRNLEPLTWREGQVLFLFFILIVLWLIRDFSGEIWLFFFKKEFATDGTIALFVGVLPMILPNKNPFQKNWFYEPILPWNYVSETFPWGVFMLQGAGLAIADGFKASDLAKTLATFLGFLVGSSKTMIVLFVTIFSAVFTEFSSNLAAASILFPVLDSIARVARIHPAHLILPSCMAVSLSFILPIATPPNAMIMESGHVKIIDMIKTGIVIKIFGIIVIFLESIFLIEKIFHIDNVDLIYKTSRLINGTLS